MTRLAVLLVAGMLAVPAQAHQRHWIVSGAGSWRHAGYYYGYAWHPWRPYYSLDSLMNAKWCARYAYRWWGIRRHAPKGCW